MAPKVSIIVPIFNVGLYLEQCLHSLVNQTMSEIEIILVEDCSTDNSCEIAENWSKRDGRIRLIKHETNSGLSASRNTGLRDSRAPFILFVDSDDYVASDYCEQLYGAITKYQADMAMCRTATFSSPGCKGSSFGHYWDCPSKSEEGCCSLDEEILKKINSCVWNKIYRRDLIADNNLEFPVGLKHEDEYWWRLYTCYAKNIAWTQKQLCFYRLRSDSIMRQIHQDEQLNLLQIGIRVYEEINKRGIENKKKLAFKFIIESLVTQYQRISVSNNSKGLQQKMQKVAHDFIERNALTLKDFSGSKENVYHYIMGETFKKGYLKTVSTPEKEKYFLGERFLIWAWKYRYGKGYIKGYLFGFILLWKKKIVE